MFSNAAKLIQSTVIVAAVATAAFSPSTASAGIFGDIGKAAKSVGKAVTHPKETVRAVEHDVKTGVIALEHPKELVRETEHVIADGRVMKDLHAVGKVVGHYYDGMAKLTKDVPLVQDFNPLMRDAARAARSSAGEIGAVAGGVAAVYTGGASALLMRAGSAGYATFVIKREAERRAAEAKAEVKAQTNKLRSY